MIGAPMYGGQCYDAFLLGVWDLQHECHKRGLTLGINVIRNESLIPRARNRILADFMASQCSHLIMIDSDIGFEGGDVLRLLAHNKPLIGATYAKKNRHHYAPAFVPMAGAVFQREDDGLAEVQCIPGGFMMMQRETVARLQGQFHDLWYWDQHGTERRRIHDLFGCYTDENRQFWSEDYAFCQRWRQAGGQVWMDPFISLTHNGTTTFDGDPTQIFRQVPDAEAPKKESIRVTPGNAKAAKAELARVATREAIVKGTRFEGVRLGENEYFTMDAQGRAAGIVRMD